MKLLSKIKKEVKASENAFMFCYAKPHGGYYAVPKHLVCCPVDLSTEVSLVRRRDGGYVDMWDTKGATLILEEPLPPGSFRLTTMPHDGQTSLMEDV